jgi:hypothetical protein
MVIPPRIWKQKLSIGFPNWDEVSVHVEDKMSIGSLNGYVGEAKFSLDTWNIFYCKISIGSSK